MNHISRNHDRVRLAELSKDKLIDLLFIQVKNIWRVDGLYFQEIEKSFGVDNAAKIDRLVWESLAKIEARDLKNMFGYTYINDIKSLMELLINTSWALYQEEKKYYVHEERSEGELYVVKCRIQEARIRKGLGIFPCRNVRFNYLRSFVEELNARIKVEAISCPPDMKEPGYWCGWRFKIYK
jgi:hypothetical protein